MPAETRLLSELEVMVDAWGLGTVLNALRDVCTMKAEHVREGWQDDRLAKDWGHAAWKLTHVADNLAGRNPATFGDRSQS